MRRVRAWSNAAFGGIDSIPRVRCSYSGSPRHERRLAAAARESRFKTFVDLPVEPQRHVLVSFRGLHESVADVVIVFPHVLLRYRSCSCSQRGCDHLRRLRNGPGELSAEHCSVSLMKPFGHYSRIHLFVELACQRNGALIIANQVDTRD